MSQSADANVGFTLSPTSRSTLIRILDAFAAALPQASAVLTDKAGRIVEIARKPVAVDLEAIAALAAGCNASTNELARSLGDDSFMLFFEHEDDRQVFVWPVGDRALLLVLLKGGAWGEQLEELVDGKLGKELSQVIGEGREPLQAVPPPRIKPPEPPPKDIAAQMQALSSKILMLQSSRAKEFTPEVNAYLVKVREDVVQNVNRKDWPRVTAVCNTALDWLNRAFP